jgi:hypothetical protein
VIQELSRMKLTFFSNNDFNSDEDFFYFLDQAQFTSKEPFSDELNQFIESFSKSILLDKNSRKFSELIVMANFFKRRSKQYSNNEQIDNKSQTLRYPLGLTFHIAPSNVDTIFLYSSLIAFICGNSCLIRISKNSSPQVNFVLHKLNATLDNFPQFKSDLIIFTYEHNKEITKRISKYVSARVTWGGDQSIQDIKKIPINPLARELSFPNRFSFAVLKSSEVIKNSINISELVKRFINDTFLFSQQACSSPRSIIWIGSKAENKKAKELFWTSYELEILSTDAENSEGMIMDRFVASSLFTSLDKSKVNSDITKIGARLNIRNLKSKILRDHHPGNGLLLQLEISSLNKLSQQLQAKDQTITYFGLQKNEIISFLKKIDNRAIDRVLPIGDALSFTSIWDGYDLYDQFTRKILIK